MESEEATHVARRENPMEQAPWAFGGVSFDSLGLGVEFDLAHRVDVMRRDVGDWRILGETPVDGVKMIGGPDTQVLAPPRASHAHQAIVFPLGFENDFVRVHGERRNLQLRAGGADRVIAHAGRVGDCFIEPLATIGRQIAQGLDIEAKQLHQSLAAEMAAEVLHPVVGVGASAVGGGDGEQGLHVLGHVQVREHEAGIESAQRMGDQQQFLAVRREEGKLLEDRLLELSRAAFNAGRGVDAGNDDAVTAVDDGAIDAMEVRDFDRPCLEVAETEQSMMHDDRNHLFGNATATSILCTKTESREDAKTDAKGKKES